MDYIPCVLRITFVKVEQMIENQPLVNNGRAVNLLLHGFIPWTRLYCMVYI